MVIESIANVLKEHNGKQITPRRKEMVNSRTQTLTPLYHEGDRRIKTSSVTTVGYQCRSTVCERVDSNSALLQLSALNSTQITVLSACPHVLSTVTRKPVS
jgi:hypothetical protein